MNDKDLPPSDWKLKLRYGKLITPFKHFIALANGEMLKETNAFDCPVGPAWMAMKTWASDADESADMVQVIGEELGFNVSGKIEIYETQADEPPKENPYGYGINFTPYSVERRESTNEGAR